MRRQLSLLWAAAFAHFVSFYLLLPTLPLYAREVGVSSRAIGVIVGCFAVSAMLFKPVAGWASDRFGRRPLLLAGSAIYIVSSLAYGAATSVPALVVVRLVHGAGMGLYPTAASTVVADLAPPARRGEYLGFFGAAANVAMALGPLVGILVAERAGFPPLFAASAACAAVALGLSALVPETLGEPRRLPLRPGAALSRAALFPSAVALALMVTYGAQVSFLPLHADEQGVNPGVFFLVFALVVALVRGRAGRWSDQVGRVPVTVLGLALAAAGLIALALTRGLAGLVAAGALYGVGFGAAQPALMAWCVDRVGPQDRGRAIGTFYAAWEMGIAIGAMSTGLAVGAVGFPPTYLAMAAVAAAAALLALAGRRR